MSIGPSFDTGILRIRLKAAEDKVKAFESGEKYVRMQEQFKAVFREQLSRMLKSAGWKKSLERPMRRRLMSGKYGPRYLMMFIGKRMRENLPCAKRSRVLGSASSKWNARGMPLWTDCAMSCGIKTANYMN